MRRVIHCNTRLAKEKRRTQGTRIGTCAKKIQLAELQLQKDRTDVEVRGILFDTQGKLVEIFQASVARNWHFTSANWFRYGDTCSKVFFDFHCIGKKKTLMRELETNSGTIMGQQDIIHHVTSFYSRFSTLDASTPDIVEAQDHC